VVAPPVATQLVALAVAVVMGAAVRTVVNASTVVTMSWR